MMPCQTVKQYNRIAKPSKYNSGRLTVLQPDMLAYQSRWYVLGIE